MAYVLDAMKRQSMQLYTRFGGYVKEPVVPTPRERCEKKKNGSGMITVEGPYPEAVVSSH